jgi:hypothetical protein
MIYPTVCDIYYVSLDHFYIHKFLCYLWIKFRVDIVYYRLSFVFFLLFIILIRIVEHAPGYFRYNFRELRYVTLFFQETMLRVPTAQGAVACSYCAGRRCVFILRGATFRVFVCASVARYCTAQRVGREKKLAKNLPILIGQFVVPLSQRSVASRCAMPMIFPRPKHFTAPKNIGSF